MVGILSLGLVTFMYTISLEEVTDNVENKDDHQKIASDLSARAAREMSTALVSCGSLINSTIIKYIQGSNCELNYSTPCTSSVAMSIRVIPVS